MPETRHALSSPLQNGLLFNSLSLREPGVDVIQVICQLPEAIKPAPFLQSWRIISARYEMLRTAFRWEETAQPRQELYAEISVPFRVEDWSGSPAGECEERLECFLREDRQQAFSVWTPPLWRVALFQLSAEASWCVFTFHHAILDGRSLPTVLGDVFACYRALLDGTLEAAERPPAPSVQAEAAPWWQPTNQEADELFWRQTLAGFETPLTLPEEEQSVVEANLLAAGASHSEEDLALSYELSQALRAFATEHDLTLNAVLQGAWSFVLSCYSGQKDVVFGEIRSCRPRLQTEEKERSSVGFFLNTLPVRVSVDHALSLLPWLQSIRAYHRALREHQLTPLVQVQQWSQVSAGRPLFANLFVFEYSTLQSTLRARYPDWQDRHVFLRRKPSYPLTLYIFAEAEILAKLVYAPGRFSAATMQRMLAQLRNVLCQMVATPDMTLADLRLLTAEERQRILCTWNSTTHDHDTRPIHEQVAARAAACPHRLAIQSGASSLTYAQLNRQANRLAHFLRAQGVGPERRVGICMARSPDMIIAQLGVLKAGGAFVSLDPEYPAERLSFLLRDAGVTLLLTSRHLLPVFAHQPWQAIALDEEPGVLAAWSEENPPSRLAPSNLAYIIYTSGSTGTPKGVAIQHDGLANLVSWHRRTYGLSMFDRTTHLASPAFDASVWEIWPSLTVGASLHLPARETLLDPHALIAWFTAHAITLAFLPTPLGEAVLQEEWPRESRLRALLVGGDRLQHPPRAALPFQLYNHYGPTETTVVATWTEVSPSASPELPPPIGRPIDNTRIYLLDEAGQPVPVGVPGELFIGGTGLARGYFARPDLTAERFLPDPWSTQPGGRLYRSGDLARYRSDGQIEFLGRRDQQIKLRGHRIEPGEIEATLLHYPGVATALVNLSMGSQQNREQDQASASSGPFLVAYIVAQAGQTLSSEALRHFLSQKLPPYMVPTSFLFLDALPLTPSGKIDRRALPAPRLLTDAPAEEKPRTPLEITLAEIWAQVLNPVRSSQDTSLNIHESFFEMGGHSLLAAQVVLHVNKKLHLHLPIQSLFQAPSIAQMAALISAQQGDQEDEVSAIPRLDRSRYRTRKG